MRTSLVEQGLIPLDKSWIIRMGFLDVINGYKDIVEFLNSQRNLNNDLISLKNVCENWNTNKSLNVGESGTIYRFFIFASWKLGLNKIFVSEGTLKNRNIWNDSKIVSWPIKELLKLDNGTSQWASASVLMGNNEKIENPPFKLKVTYDAVQYWKDKRSKGEVWLPRYDQTIFKQAETFKKILDGEKVEFNPEQAEDYCFARIFNFISQEEGEKRWPALRGHESDRVHEMEMVIKKIHGQIDSKDHRVVQAVAMYQKLHKLSNTVIYPESVNKSWPQFWVFLGKI